MARAASRQSRAQQYRDILGERLEDYKVLAFVCKERTATLHWRLIMDNRKPNYKIFDSINRTAYIVCPKDDETLAVLRDIASRVGAVEITPDLS